MFPGLFFSGVKGRRRYNNYSLTSTKCINAYNNDIGGRPVTKIPDGLMCRISIEYLRFCKEKAPKTSDGSGLRYTVKSLLYAFIL